MIFQKELELNKLLFFYFLALSTCFIMKKMLGGENMENLCLYGLGIVAYVLIMAWSVRSIYIFCRYRRAMRKLAETLMKDVSC